jgi:tetratricopeptide (TPR) repeat protein
MAFDRYMPCPGGTGKKIKFCCNDLFGELEVIHKMLEGEQRLACLEHVNHTLKKFPDRACLLSVKALLQQELEQDDALEETLDLFESKHPGNPLALAERAIFLAETEGGAAGVEPLHRALETVETELPGRVYEAMFTVGSELLADGEFMAARAHLLLHASIGGRGDTRGMQLLMRLMTSPEVPLLLKDDYPFSEAPADAVYKPQFDEAVANAKQGKWIVAAAQFDKIREQADDVPAVWRNLAILHSHLASHGKAVAAWKKYATLDVSQDDAVEAAALAQLLRRDAEGDTVDLVTITLTVSDVESLSAQLLADRRATRIPVDPASLVKEDEPPPMAVYYLLDRPMPDTGEGIARADVPHVLGQCYLYGRETDREARLEFIVAKSERFDAAMQSLRELCGSALGDQSEDKTLTEISAMQNALTWNWRLPRDTDPEHARKLIAEQREDTILNTWPALPNPLLDGKRPADVCGDAKSRIPLLAAILNLELAMQAEAEFEFNRLRRKLGLPEAGKIDPWNADVSNLSVVRLGRLDTLKLTDDDLVDAYRRAASCGALRILRNLAEEVVGRPSLDDVVDKAQAFGILAGLEGSSDRAIDLLHQAQEFAKTTGRSPAQWLLTELELRIQRSEPQEFQRLLARIRGRHIQEPGVGSALVNLLARYGIIGADGQPAQARPQVGEEPAIFGADSEPAGASEIWTPDSAPAAAGKKSVIWTPDD